MEYLLASGSSKKKFKHKKRGIRKKLEFRENSNKLEVCTQLSWQQLVEPTLIFHVVPLLLVGALKNKIKHKKKKTREKLRLEKGVKL